VTSHPARFLIVGQRTGDVVELDTAEARHARVRRVRPGENVVVFDGAGWSALALVETVLRERVSARIVRELRPDDGESRLDLTLAVAHLKSDRFEWMIEKAIELGVTSLVPFASKYSVARPSAARLKRWEEIAKSAVKQCGRTVFPRIAAPAELSDVLALPGPRLFFAESGSRLTMNEAFAQVGSTSMLTAVIGPEGGFAAEEVAAAREAAIVVSLGPRILRAETAAVSAVTLCQLNWGDLVDSRLGAETV
jgi:16S rRNA (uracil1498-N3)-methyltransferase